MRTSSTAMQVGERIAPYDLAGTVIGMAMGIHRVLGPGFLESVYHRALIYELTKAGYTVVTNKSVDVHYDRQLVGEFIADLVVNESLIVEIKAVETIHPSHEVQVVNYLTATGTDEGLLLNFGGQNLEFRKKFRRRKKHEEDPF